MVFPTESATSFSLMDYSPTIDPTKETAIKKGIKRVALEALIKPKVSEPKRKKKSLFFNSDFEEQFNKINTKLPPAPWKETDLLIFDDGLKNLPLNGIREPEFVEINKLYSEMCLGKSTFLQIGGDDSFKKFILEKGIKKILCRSAGRESILKLAHSGQIKIQIIPRLEARFATVEFSDTSIINAEIVVSLQVDRLSSIGKLSNGKTVPIENPLDVTLFHEFCHCCHKLEKDVAYGGLRRPSLGDEYTELSEQLAITGIRKPFSFSSEDTAECYNPLNENRYRVSWGLPLRFSHTMINMDKSNLEKESQQKMNADQLACPEKALKWKYFEDLARCGLVSQMEEFLPTLKDFTEAIHSKTGKTLINTALVYAASKDLTDSFHFLIKAGARPYVTSIWRKSPEEFEKDHLWNISYWLIAFGAPRIMRQYLSIPEVQKKINQTGSKGSILYRYIEENCTPTRINQGIIENIDLMIKLGADPSISNSLGFNAFHAAAFVGSVDVMKMLLNAGAKINACGLKGATPLFLAAVEDHTHAVEFLLSNGVDVNEPLSNGDSIVHIALRYSGPTSIPQILKIKTINYKSLGANKQSFLHCLMQNKLLDEKSVLELVGFFLERGVDWKVLDSEGKSFLDICKDDKLKEALLKKCRDQKP